MTTKEFFDWMKRVGEALSAWVWLVKLLAAVLGCAVLFVSAKGWYDSNSALAKLAEEHKKLKGEVVAQNATAAQLRREKADILADSVGLRARYAELEAKVGKLTVVATMNVSTPVGGAVAHGTPREPASKPPEIEKVPVGAPAGPYVLEKPVLLREGDRGHVQVRALTVETKGKNNVLLLEGLCFRDVPGPSVEIMRDTARTDLSEVLKLVPPGNPGTGIGPLLAIGKQGLTYGALVSPATVNFWYFQTELLLGAAGNANGDWLVLAGALGRLR